MSEYTSPIFTSLQSLLCSPPTDFKVPPTNLAWTDDGSNGVVETVHVHQLPLTTGNRSDSESSCCVEGNVMLATNSTVQDSDTDTEDVSLTYMCNYLGCK